MLNLDTHMLVAVLDGSLTEDEAELVLAHELAISDIVLWELAKLIQLDRLKLDMSSRAFRQCVRYLTVLSITIEIAHRSTRLDFKSDPADEIIAATSVVEQIPLLTRDARIHQSREVPFPQAAT